MSMTNHSLMASLQLSLRALQETQLARLTGGALHGALIRTVELTDPRGAMNLDRSQQKSFACSPLQSLTSTMETGTGTNLIARGETLTSYLTILDEETLLLFLESLLNARSRRQFLSLNRSSFEIADMRFASVSEEQPALITYRSLAAAAKPVQRIMLRFRSPTYFRSGGKVILPGDAPHLVFASYLRRWHDFSGVPFPRLSREELKSAIELHGVHDRRRLTAVLPSGTEQGETGTFTFHIAGGDDLRRMMATLGRYACYCGTGARTAFGMGHTELLE